MKIAIYCFIILFTFSSISCKKADVNPNVPNLNRELLINKKWSITAATVQPFGSTSTRDTYSSSADYEKDNYLYFNGDGRFENNANILKSPNSNSDILVSGTWELTQNNTFIKITADNGISVLSYTIIQLTENSLKTEALAPNGDLYRHTFNPIP